MKSILTIIFSFLLVVSGLAQTRNVVVGTNDVIVQPTNFWTANATNGRSGLGLGSAATNPASAFQPSSLVLTNLTSSNAVNLTNLRLSNVVGWSALTNTNAAASLLGFTTNGQVVANTGTNVLTFTNYHIEFANGDVALSNQVISGTGIAIGFEDGAVSGSFFMDGGSIEFSSTSNAATTRANLGFSTNLNTLWTATNASNARSAVGLGNTNSVQFGTTILSSLLFTNSTIQLNGNSNNIAIDFSYVGTRLFTAGLDGISFGSTFLSAATRTNLGLGWSALTNTNTSGFNASLYGSNTNPVLVDSNGSVVNPTNFWQVAPIQTLVQTFTPATNSTNAATNARNLYVYSSATNVSGITNTITLPTNASTFNGDAATITHNGNTSSVTAIKQLGSATNFTTISNYAESVKFIREDGQWTFYHNISFVEPIRFADGSIEENKAASRTNLGIPLVALTNTSNATFQQAIFTTNGPTNIGNFGNHVAWMAVSIVTNGVTNEFSIPLYK